jgi:hypothetical protein
MTATTQDVLERYEQLPIVEKKQFISIILRDSLDVETFSLSDDELVLNAEELFLDLDRREAKDAKSYILT